MIELLLREGLVEEHKSLASLVRAPLALTLALRRLKATDLRGVVPVLPTSHLILCAMLLGPGKEGVLRDGVSKVSADAYDDVLRAGIAELEGAGAGRGRLAPVLGALLERATSAQAIELSVLIDVSRTLADAGPTGREGLDRALEAVARRSDVLLHAQDATQVRQLTQAARRAELSRTGGRALLLATLYRKAPEVVRDHAWWTGVTFDQVCAAGHGPLAPALEDTAIAHRLVSPLVDAALEEAASRARLAQIISSPAPVARWVTGEALMAALERTAKGDGVAAAWADVLSDRGALSRMADQVSVAQDELARARTGNVNSRSRSPTSGTAYE